VSRISPSNQPPASVSRTPGTDSILDRSAGLSRWMARISREGMRDGCYRATCAGANRVVDERARHRPTGVEDRAWHRTKALCRMRAPRASPMPWSPHAAVLRRLRWPFNLSEFGNVILCTDKCNAVLSLYANCTTSIRVCASTIHCSPLKRS